MAFSSGGDTAHNAPKSDINTTPLVDVMLVLLIIFMITAPLLSHKVKIKLPQPNTNPSEEKIEPISLEIKDIGGVPQFILNGTPTDMRGLQLAFREQGKKPEDEQSEFKIEADDTVEYQVMAEILAAARNANVEKLGFAELFKPGDRIMQQ